MNFLVKIQIGLLLCGLLFIEAARIFGEWKASRTTELTVLLFPARECKAINPSGLSVRRM